LLSLRVRSCVLEGLETETDDLGCLLRAVKELEREREIECTLGGALRQHHLLLRACAFVFGRATENP
jgi:hypothetical protein